MVSNKKEYMQKYMQNYVANSETITCSVCGSKYREYHRYRHEKTKKHLSVLELGTLKQELTQLEQLQLKVSELENKIQLQIVPKQIEQA